MKTHLLLATLLLNAVRPAAATDLNPCEIDLLSRAAVERRLNDVKAVVAPPPTIFDAFQSGAYEKKMATTILAAISGRSPVEARAAFDTLSHALDNEAALAAYTFDAPQITELVLMAFVGNLSIEQMIGGFVAMTNALGARGEGSPVLSTLVKIALFHHRTPDEVIAVLDEVRRGAPEVERRVRDGHAAVVARHSESRLARKGPWLTDEILLAVVEAALAEPGRTSVAEDLAVAGEVTGDEVGALYTGPEQEAVIKAAIVLNRPVSESLAKLAEFEARTFARFGDHLDENLEPLLIYMMLLGQRAPLEVVDFLDHLAVAGEDKSEIVALTVIARTNFELVPHAPLPSLLRAAMFNAFH